VATEQTFRGQFAVDCRTALRGGRHLARKKTVDLKNHATGEVTTENYDKLVLSPGRRRSVRRCPASIFRGSSR